MARTMAGSDESAARVEAILTAAEEAAESIRAEAEAKMEARIAEGGRAADNRVRAAEGEALEILANAQAEADRIQAEAASKALETVARADEEASKALEDARKRASEMLRDARTVAGQVKSEGVELTEHLRELSDSLRTNAGRLLQDILDVHSSLTAGLDRVDGGRGTGSRARDEDVPSRRDPGGGDLEVPEFVPGRR